jgi:choline kinase
MKNVVILAAGTGSRLKPLTENLPKCCLQIGSETLIERIIMQLSRVSQNSDVKLNIYVVGGFCFDFLKAEIKKLPVNVNLILNEYYLETNNMESCRMALVEIPLKDTLIINADCAYDYEIVSKMVLATMSCIGIDSSQFFEENMKVNLKKNLVTSISKELKNEDNNYTSIDIYNFLMTDVSELQQIMSLYKANGDLKKWNEVAIDELVKNKDVGVIDFSGLKWVEIDTLDDLKIARQLW